jgi:hypothetical protein
MLPLVGIPETAVDIVRQLESEGQFPNADYAFDLGVIVGR